MEIFTYFTGLIIGVLTIIVAFKEGRDWIKLNIQKFLMFAGNLNLNVSEEFRSKLKLLFGVFLEILFFFGKLILLLYFVFFPLVVAYFFFPPFQEIITKVFTGSHFDTQGLKTIAPFAGIYLYFITILIFVYFVYRRFDNLRNRVIHLYMLKPIMAMNNEQREIVFQTVKSSWSRMIFEFDQRIYPTTYRPPGNAWSDARERMERELINLLVACTPVSFEKGIFSIECPDPLVRKKLYNRQFEVQLFLARRIEFLTGMGYKDNYPETMYYNLSEVEFLPSRDVIDHGSKEKPAQNQENSG